MVIYLSSTFPQFCSTWPAEYVEGRHVGRSSLRRSSMTFNKDLNQRIPSESWHGPGELVCAGCRYKSLAHFSHVWEDWLRALI